MGRKRCSHGKRKDNCAACNPCPHGKLKGNCANCNPCPHKNVKRNCAACNPCAHGKLKRNCVDCNACPHDKLKGRCAACKPCPHGRLKSDCAACKPCPHNKLKRRCAACKASAAPQQPPALAGAPVHPWLGRRLRFASMSRGGQRRDVNAAIVSHDPAGSHPFRVVLDHGESAWLTISERSGTVTPLVPAVGGDGGNQWLRRLVSRRFTWLTPPIIRR
jgi:hypothetical protein